YTMSPTYSVCADHGYIKGEHFNCPDCGRKTEVYSRITGYYRPVQNWNDGKTQEFKDRTTYVIENSVLTHEGPKPQEGEPCACEAPAEDAGDKLMLFVSETCPNCAMAESVLNKAGVAYEKLMASENPELVNRYGITQAPTLIAANGASYDTFKGVSAIIGMLRK
ncbi:MAG: ribonucleoside triphosphate reductase, partial [Clostridia bacterium]|nr:ribonucleoside triphosphate reductase [Clostridia bacterium]